MYTDSRDKYSTTTTTTYHVLVGGEVHKVIRKTTERGNIKERGKKNRECRHENAPTQQLLRCEREAAPQLALGKKMQRRRRDPKRRQEITTSSI